MARICVLIGPMFEDIEYTRPAEELRDEGHKLVHVSTGPGSMEGKHGTVVDIEVQVDETSVDEYDALFIPGGFSPDQLRGSEAAVNFVREFMDSGKPVFAMCHAPQLLMSAGRVNGRRLTAWKTVQSDLKYTRAEVVDEPVVEDDNLVTSRMPDDISAFLERVKGKLKNL